jgi:hypothetical protein
VHTYLSLHLAPSRTQAGGTGGACPPSLYSTITIYYTEFIEK